LRLILIVLTLISQQISDGEKDRLRSSEMLAEIAVDNCKNVRQHKRSSALLIAKQIALWEHRMDVPDEMLGIALSAACLESGFNPKAKGDRKFSKSGRPKAVGLYQMWPWWKTKRGYSVDRQDVESSTKAWLSHIKKQIPKVEKRCRTRTLLQTWVAAWVHAVRAPKAGGRCRETPKHYRYFKKIRKEFEIQKKYVPSSRENNR